jgi:hypothetical protein
MAVVRDVGIGAALAEALNPVTALAAGIGLVAAAFVALSGDEQTEAQAAQAVATAKNAEKDAIDGFNSAITGAGDATKTAAQADDAHRKAIDKAREALDKYGKNSRQYKQAAQAEVTAQQGATKAHQSATSAVHRANDAATQQAKKAQETAKKIQDLTNAQAKNALFSGSSAKVAAFFARSQDENARAADRVRVAQARQATTQLAINRYLQTGKLISDRNVVSIASLGSVYNRLPKSVQIKLAASPEAALASLGQLTSRLNAIGQHRTVARILTTAPSAAAAIAAMKAVLLGVPASKVLRILHNALSTTGAINALQAAVNALPASRHISINAGGNAIPVLGGILASINAIPSNKNVTVTTTNVKHHASGRGSGQVEAALVGEGGAPEWVVNRATGALWKTPGPMFAGLTADDYVIPTEQRYRGRALGLLASLMRDLGIAGYAAGRKPRKRPTGSGALPEQPVPHGADPHAYRHALSLDLQDVQSREQSGAVRLRQREVELRRRALRRALGVEERQEEGGARRERRSSPGGTRAQDPARTAAGARLRDELPGQDHRRRRRRRHRPERT